MTFDTSGLFVYKEFFKVQLIRELINHVLLYTGIKRPGALAYSSTCQNFAWGDIKNYVLKMGHDVLGATTLNTSYLTDSYIVFTLELESGFESTIFGLKMMMKRCLEKFVLKSLHARR